MSRAEPGRPLMEWAVASRPAPGEAVCGDGYLVLESDGRTLVAVIDGLGHGAEAATAWRTAVGVLQDANVRESPDSLLRRCHRGLARTRGAAISLAVIEARGAMEWVGVGNVEGALLRYREQERSYESLLVKGGVVGYQMPTLRRSVTPLSTGDMLIFVTDGVRPGFTGRVERDGPVQAMAERILSEHGRGNDDALVLVARYLGDGASDE